MQSQHPLPAPPTTGSEDARDLLARLYREIGISAVASALHAMKSGNAEALAVADPHPFPHRKIDVAA